VPGSSFSWVSERGEFAEYLSQKYPVVVDDENGILYSLGSVPERRDHWPRQDSSTDDGVVSVILPVHNAIRPAIGDRWLHESIHSVLNQDGIQVELLIVDDGSVDGTEHVLADYDDRPIVNVITLQKWRGYGAAMNIGADAAIGSFLARISVGDRFLPGKLVAQQTAMVDKQLDLVGGNVQVIDETGAQVGGTRLFPDSDDGIRSDILDGLALHPSSTMMRRRVWAEAGGYTTDPAFRFAEDLEFFARVAAHPAAFRFGNVETVLCEDRYHEGRVTRSPLTRDLSRKAGQHVRNEAGPTPAAAARR
jgi:glycosyltransferase involved in cell wall biosynthesis